MISVAIPAFKTLFLDQAIMSILNQTYKDFELIIVNDASPNNIEEITSKFVDPRIRYYKNEYNVGFESVVKNWNKCLDYAKGEYFVLFSDDDICERNYLEEMWALSQKYPRVDIIHCRLLQIDEKNKILNVAPICPEFEDGIEFIWQRIKGHRLQAAPEFMVKTDVLKRTGGFIDLPLAWGSDDLTWFKLSLNHGIAYSQKALVSWRLSDFNISKTGNVKKRIHALQIYENWLEQNLFTHTKFKDYPYNKFIIQDLQSWIHNLRLNLISFAKMDLYIMLDILKNYKKMNIRLIDLFKIILNKIRINNA